MWKSMTGRKTCWSSITLNAQVALNGSAFQYDYVRIVVCASLEAVPVGKSPATISGEESVKNKLRSSCCEKDSKGGI